ncbi:ATP-binding protein [Bacillus coahuilensis]|uniref:ATP-binding protein n=1 Tax=Bacillus coahuilensis TaxID=408580 RepID=UPI0002FD814F|nr:AAA family ATPase [Bacillus coahuilensis]
MKIIGLHIYGFGKLSNFTINNLEEMRVFFGDNEVGKTTIQQFILTMLFGFKKEKLNDPNYTPILSSKYGGKLFIEEDRYHIRMIERVKGVNKGEAIVVSQEGKEYGEEVLKRLLNGLDRDMYEKVYSFNVFDLQELHTFDGLELNRFFFSTSLAGTKDFFHLEKEVEKKKLICSRNPVKIQSLINYFLS